MEKIKHKQALGIDQELFKVIKSYPKAGKNPRKMTNTFSINNLNM